MVLAIRESNPCQRELGHGGGSPLTGAWRFRGGQGIRGIGQGGERGSGTIAGSEAAGMDTHSDRTVLLDVCRFGAGAGRKILDTLVGILCLVGAERVVE